MPTMSRIRHLEVQHLIVAAVAGGTVALALAGGGFEPTAFATAGLTVWLLALIGLATGIAPRSRPPGEAIAAGLALAGLAAMMALSLAWASDDGNGFEDVVRALAYLGLFVVVVVAARPGEARPWLAGLAIGLTTVGAIALLARFEPAPFGNPDADLARTLPAAIGRLIYPIGYWNGLAATMAAAVVLLSWFAASSTSRRVRSASVAAMPLVILALWMTDSRGGIIAAGIALAVLLVAGPWRSGLVANVVVGGLAGVALVLVSGGFSALLDDPLSPDAGGEGDAMLAITLGLTAATYAVRYGLDSRLQEFRISMRVGKAVLAAVVALIVAGLVVIDPVEQWDEFKAPPTGLELRSGEVGLLRGGGSGRYQFWETAVDAFASAPVEGVGSSGYTPYWFEHREVPIPATRAHSVLFETLAELGFVGLALLLGFFAVATYAGIRRLRAPDRVVEAGPALALLVVGFAAAAVDWTWDLPAVFASTAVAAALLTGPATLASESEAPTSRWIARSRRRFAGGVVVLLVAWISICGSALLLLSANSLDASGDAADRGDIQAAVDAANDAIDLQPWSAEPRQQLALVYEQAGQYEEAREAIDEAIERSPDDYRLRLLAARIAGQDGDAVAAQAALGDAYRLNPRDPGILETLRVTG